MANEFLDINGLSHFKDKLDQAQADVLRYSSQSLTDAQKTQARTNIGAGTYSKPDTGIPSSDMASAVQTSLGKADSAYQKPDTGIPSTDMTAAVQTSLGKADTALQSFTETDPTVPAWAKASTKPTYSYSEIQNTPTIPELTDYTDAELQTAIDTAFANL